MKWKKQGVGKIAQNDENMDDKTLINIIIKWMSFLLLIYILILAIIDKMGMTGCICF